eukprot:5370850-Pyramimonas_sp.AAC.1
MLTTVRNVGRMPSIAFHCSACRSAVHNRHRMIRILVGRRATWHSLGGILGKALRALGVLGALGFLGGT